MVLEKSHEKLEADQGILQAIRIENEQLRLNCDSIQKENQQLKTRLEKIENKLMDNNLILHGVEDQV